MQDVLRRERGGDATEAKAAADSATDSGLSRAVLQRKIAQRIQRKAAAQESAPELEAHGRGAKENQALAQATADIPNQDVIYEQLCHNGAKGRMDPEVLSRWGYLQSDEFEDSSTGIRVVAFLPSKHLEANPELAESAARQHDGMPLRPVLAFRGTDNKAGVLDDMSTTGIGTYQYSHAEGQITSMLVRAAGGAGQVDLIGHSLGGALAQICAARNPGLAGRVVTFQSPGINASEVKKLADYNAKAPDDKKVGATHYRMDNDLVHQAGQAHLDGDIYKFHLQGADTALSHKKFPLAMLNAARGGPVEGTYEGKSDFGADGRLAEGATVAEDELERVERTTAKKDRNTFIRNSSEAVRVGAGLARNLGSHLSGNQDVASMDSYVRAWDEVKRMRDGGAPPETIRARIDSDKSLDEGQREQMRQNLEAMYGPLGG